MKLLINLFVQIIRLVIYVIINLIVNQVIVVHAWIIIHYIKAIVYPIIVILIKEMEMFVLIVYKFKIVLNIFKIEHVNNVKIIIYYRIHIVIYKSKIVKFNKKIIVNNVNNVVNWKIMNV